VVAINFAVVPAQYRVLFVNVVAFFWGIYVSGVANKDDIRAHHPEVV
jgi:hypothetical protein